MSSLQNTHISNTNTLSILYIYICVCVYMHSCMWVCVCVCITVIKEWHEFQREWGGWEGLQREERGKWCNYISTKTKVKLGKDKKTRTLVYKLLKRLFRKRNGVERKATSKNDTRNFLEVNPLWFLAKGAIKRFMLEEFMTILHCRSQNLEVEIESQQTPERITNKWCAPLTSQSDLDKTDSSFIS